jgi:excisionase family DNA binding protein
MPQTTNEPLMTVREAATWLNMSEDAVRRLIRQKRIHASDVSKTKRVIYRVPVQALEEFLAA